MRLSDRVNQRALYVTAAVIQIVGMSLLALFPLTMTVALVYIFPMQFGSGFGAQSFFQLWSAELFPTLLRATARLIGSAGADALWTGDLPEQSQRRRGYSIIAYLPALYTPRESSFNPMAPSWGGPLPPRPFDFAGDIGTRVRDRQENDSHKSLRYRRRFH